MKKKEESHRNMPVEGTVLSEKKPRQSNMELLRLLSMLFVLMLHANYLALGVPTQADLMHAPLPATLRVLFEHFAIVAVDVFVLISGWFGIRPRWKGFSNLLFQMIFLSYTVMACFLAAGLPASTKTLLKTIYIGSAHWFVVAYMGLYILAPLLNMFAANSTKRQIKLFLTGFFAFEFIYGFVTDSGHYIGGYSMLSFIGLYLLAQYLRRYPGQWQERSGKHFLFLYALTMSASAILFLFMLYLGHNEGRLTGYISPLVILGSVFLLMAFSRLSLQSRLVNWMAASCFSIYFIHCQPLVFPYYKEWFKSLYDHFSGVPYLLLAMLCLLDIGFGCILIDQLRIACWRRILPVLENKVVPWLRRICPASMRE